jgi:hypothetical protein
VQLPISPFSGATDASQCAGEEGGDLVASSTSTAETPPRPKLVPKIKATNANAKSIRFLNERRNTTIGRIFPALPVVVLLLLLLLLDDFSSFAEETEERILLSFWCVFVCCAETYTRLKSHKHERTNERERERVRENSARSAPLLKRCLKRREKSLFLSLFLSSSLALTQTTFAPKKRFDLSFFLFPFSSGIVVSRARRFLSFSLFFSSRLSSETRRDRAFRDIYIRARARDQREVRRMNTPSEKKEKRRSAERSALSLTRILIWKGKDKKKRGRKNLPRLFFSSSVWHIFFFCFCICLFFIFFFHEVFFSRHNEKCPPLERTSTTRTDDEGTPRRRRRRQRQR